MTYQVTLSPSQHTFLVDADAPLLESALHQAIGLPYGCKSGVCGACKGKVLSGAFSHGSASEYALSPSEREQGFTLLCCATAHTDLTIEIREIQSSADYPVKIMPARVQSMHLAAPDVMILQLKLPASEKLRFRPGQYIDILLKSGERRSFSIANAPHVGDVLELHVRQVTGGQFTGHVFNSMKARDILRLEGPLGSFYLHEDSTTPIILLAGGTGFAPIKAIVEDAIETRETRTRRSMHLYWGASDPAGLYLDELARQWAANEPWFRYTPVVSSNAVFPDWTGRTGLVHHVLMADYHDLSAHRVYACGSPAMIAAAKDDLLTQCGLTADAFFSDAFTFSPPPA
jgi:CDP-4-dehydro-6-deoxyglucose reductase